MNWKLLDTVFFPFPLHRPLGHSQNENFENNEVMVFFDKS